jgi:hypothetical protein
MHVRLVTIQAVTSLRAWGIMLVSDEVSADNLRMLCHYSLVLQVDFDTQWTGM